MNRLRSAVYQRPGAANAVPNSYNESMTYDKNGNIQTLQRNGDFDSQTTAIQIDNLNYNYNSTSPNQLLSIKDNVSTSDSVLGFSDGNLTGNDYNYDNNGNLISDLNKKVSITSTNKPTLSNIKYNHLNLPVEIFFASNRKINYIYNAQGVKIQKIITFGTNQDITDYLDGFQYLKSINANLTVPTLQFFPTSEGYVNFDSGVYKYVYNYVDHLGNVRVSYTKNATVPAGISILEENHYYPFGLKHTNYNTTTQKLRGGGVVSFGAPPNKYKYNGQEWQDELGLNMTAMDFRQYDNALGRFNSIDALSDIEHNFSTYSFSRNNPIMFNDPSGLSPDYEDGDDTAWNAGLEGFDASSRPPSFEGQGVTQNDMQSGDPMGGEMKDLVIQNNFSEGFDKNGIIDLDRDANDSSYEIDIKSTLVSIGTNALQAYQWYNRNTTLNFKADIGIDLLKFKGYHFGVAEFESSLVTMGAITPGNFVLYPKGGSTNPYFSNHQPGHVLQYRMLGSLYYPLVAIPSAIYSATHTSAEATQFYTEKSANTLWYLYTGETDSGNPRYF